MKRRKRDDRKKGLKKRRRRRRAVKGACEHGSGDGNPSLVFTMSVETYEFLGQCVREHMLRSKTQTNSFTLGGWADFRLKRESVNTGNEK